MKKLLTVIVVLLIVVIKTNTSHSTHQYWAKTYGSGDEAYHSIQLTTDGNYILAGTKELPSPGGIGVFKLDNTGNILWQNTYLGNVVRAQIIQQTLDDGFVVISLKFDTDIVILKLDSNGDISWQKVYDFGHSVRDPSIKQTADSGYLITAYLLPDPHIFGMDILVMKLDNNGNIIWTKSYGAAQSEIQDTPGLMLEASDGSYFITGSTGSVGAVGINQDALVMKLDSNGDIIWQKAYGANLSRYYYSAFAIVPTIDGEFVVAVSGNVPGLDTDFWLLKIDNGGNITWGKGYEREPSGSLSSFKKTLDESFIVAGSTYSADDRNTLIAKLDGNGNVLWDKTFFGIEEDDDAISLQITPDDECIVGSRISISDYSYNTLLLKLDSSGNIPGCNMFESNSVIVSDVTFSNRESALIISSVSCTVENGNFIPQDTTTEIALVCCYDPEDNDFDCVPEEEDNCSNHHNSNQLDSYPPQFNNCGDACECEGNFNSDEDYNVDGTDLALFKADYGRNEYNQPCSLSTPCDGNFDCDNNVDGDDLAVFKADYGRNQYNNPCPPCFTDPWCETYQ